MSSTQDLISGIYQMKITLKDIKPPIWRRFQIAGNMPLYKLHKVIQIVMGWEDYHLHEFHIAGKEYGVPDPDYPSDVIPEQRVKIGQALTREKMRFSYIYDFGDNWKHELLVEKILLPEPRQRYPQCLAGKRHTPPEDVGGHWGYERFLEAITNPDNEQHEELLSWIGGSFDPEEFNLDEINNELKRVR